jgi:hypothetical protein
MVSSWVLVHYGHILASCRWSWGKKGCNPSICVKQEPDKEGIHDSMLDYGLVIKKVHFASAGQAKAFVKNE